MGRDAVCGGFDEGADEVADHVMQEAGAGDAVKEETVFLLPAGAIDGADVGGGVARVAGAEVGVPGGEAGEVVLAEYVAGGSLRGGQGDGPGAIPDERGQGWGADLVGEIGVRRNAREDAVLVDFAQSAVAGVEGLWGGGSVFGGEHADGWRERAVERAKEIGGWNGRGKGEAGDLAQGVDTCIRASRALRQDGLPGNPLKGGGERALNGGELGLYLPTTVGRAIVCEDEFPKLHGISGKYHGEVRAGQAGMGRAGWYSW